MTTPKTPKQFEKQENSRPQATEALAEIIEVAITFHGEAKLTLSGIARLARQASRLLRIKDLDEKLSVENATVITLAKKHGLVS